MMLQHDLSIFKWSLNLNKVRSYLVIEKKFLFFAEHNSGVDHKMFLLNWLVIFKLINNGDGIAVKTNENNPEHNSNGQQEQDCRSEVTTPAAECQGGPGVKSLIEGYSKNGTSKDVSTKELQKSSQLAATTNQQQCDLVPPTRSEDKRRSSCTTLAVPVSLLVYCILSAVSVVDQNPSL